jgi:hypothetical protein
LGLRWGEWPAVRLAALVFLGFQCLGAPSPWPPDLEKKVRGGRNRQVVGGGVWAAGKVAESRWPGWWLPAFGPGPGGGVISERLACGGLPLCPAVEGAPGRLVGR